jgi:hypothetical protein
MKILNQTTSVDQLGKFIEVAVVISDLATLQLYRLIETKLPSNQLFYVELINEYESGNKMYHVISPKRFQLK